MSLKYFPFHSGFGSVLGVAAVLCGSARGGDVGAAIDERADWRFPPTAAVIDVTRPPYGARGDGTTDDTAALQRALTDAMGRRKIVYLPNGTYLVSAPLVWSKKGTGGFEAWGFNWIQGQNPVRTVLRLKDGVLTDPAKPRAVMECGGFGSADWFHNYVQGLTIDVGRRNPGAVGLQFYSNNTGALRDLVIRSGDGSGAVGLDLGSRDMNGPLLVRNVVVRGFEVGIATGRPVNSQTFEHVTLEGQRRFGLDNEGQTISIRDIVSDNAVPAVRSYGRLLLTEARLTGRGAARDLPAVVNYNGGRIHLRDVAATGYRRAASSVETPDFSAAFRLAATDQKTTAGSTIDEYFSHAPTSPFGGPPRSLWLKVEKPPEVPWDDPSEWAVADSFGADPSGVKDSSTAIQKAIDSGATTVFLPGCYAVERSVVIRGRVRRVLGTGGWIDYASKSKPDLIVADGEAASITIEHFAPINGGVEVLTARPVLLRSVETRLIKHVGKGPLFLEDVATDDVRVRPGRRVWARQLNVENEGTHVTNDGGSLWVLGYKTERGGTLLHTKNHGRSEILGGFSYTTTAGKLAPMFVTDDAAAFAFFGEVCYNGDPFAFLIKEIRGGVTRVVKRGEGATEPYVGQPANE